VPALKQKPNRLINEKSPYLQQHAYNPVDWYSWSEEAFSKAVDEDKPVFVSIGYSTCHWCHVMEKESFEKKEVAEILNSKFVSIKVDREERPDIDNIYMKASLMMTGTGGWPLTIIMTPQKQPFFAGTYLPKTSRTGMTGLIEVLHSIAENWEKRRRAIMGYAEKASNYIIESSQANQEKATVDRALLDEGFIMLLDSFDNMQGGFGYAPKFPSPHNLLFLLRYHKTKGNKRAIEMVEKTLQRMRLGGIFDQLGFGFHRYSTDSNWLIPHFEKMLYDQALMCMVYSEAYQATSKTEYKQTAEAILQYVLTEMVDETGGFYSAEDADSEGQEGKFYLWTRNEISETLGDEAETFCKIFNVSEEGNFTSAHDNVQGMNILHMRKPLNELTSEIHMSRENLEAFLKRTTKTLFEKRQTRIRPFKDTKILTDWNGLMIASLAKCAQAFDSEKYAEAAKKALELIFRKMLTQSGTLLHRYKDGEAAVEGMIDDYAFLIWGLIETYEATYVSDWLKKAIMLKDTMIEKFWDKKETAFFFAPETKEKELPRLKEFNDAAIPSGNSVALLNLARLSRLTGRVDFEEKAAALGQTITAYSGQLNTMFLAAATFSVGPTHEVVVVGDPQSPNTLSMLKNANAIYCPNRVVLFKSNNDDALAEVAAYTRFMKTIDSEPAAYICSNFTCKRPITDVDQVSKILRSL
jgi:uncharacterized protein YyaL (SSP411 family)